MPTLYYSPGACSIGIHVLLEEIGKPFEAKPVSLAKGEQYQPPFTQVNPKSKVPTLLRDDGSTLTEYPAIALWLAWTNPEARLLPDDLEARTRSVEAMDYAVATIHMQGFSRVFRPGNFSPDEAQHEAVKARGRELMTKGFDLIDRQLAGKDYVAGDFSVADSALFYVEYWTTRIDLPLPPNCQAHLQRMKARPSVGRVMQKEGLG